MDQTNKKEETDFKKWLKLIFSSLFMRKMSVVLMGDGSKTWLFSTLSPEEHFNRFNIEDALHRVTFKGNDIDCFFEKFPVFKTGIWQVNPNNVNSFSNLFDNLQIKQQGMDLVMEGTVPSEKVNSKKISKHIKDNSEELEDSEIQVGTHPVGKISYDYEYRKYQAVFTDLENLQTIGTLPIDTTKINKSKVLPIKIDSKILDEVPDKATITVPLLDGHTNVSVNEYIKKTKKVFTMKFKFKKEHRTIFSMVEFENENLRVTSVRPQMKWFF